MLHRAQAFSRRHTTRLNAARGAFLALVVLAATVVPLTEPAAAATLTRTFNYSATAQTFTVPDGVHSISLSVLGAQGGRGGPDTHGQPTPGGYRGVLTGSVDVTPGQVLTIGVGSGGATAGKGTNLPGGVGGLNPFDGYDGGRGGRSGTVGGSGAGGGGGAASVVRISGTDGAPDVELVAAGAGGGGGNGQFLPVIGRQAESQHSPRPDATSTEGRFGKDAATVCSPGYNCDGGGSGAGGAGVQGGDQGDVQYGGATATEYFGFGGYPGSNGTGGLDTLSESYEYFADNNGHGSVTISYESGTPGAPTRLSGTPRSGAVDLTWSAPGSSGSAAITDYLLWSSTTPNGTYTLISDGESATTSASVTGLTNGTTYYFRVAAVNSYGTGANSAPMSVGVMPSDVPGAPRLDRVTAADSSLVVDITAGATHSPVIGHEYRLDGGDWVGAQAEAGRITIGGLTNGQNYAVQVRARNAVGASAPSAELSGSPRAVPSTPANLVVTPGNGRAELRWDPPAASNGSPIQDYVVERATVETGPYSVVVDGISTDPAATLTGLTNGTTYYFRVAAVNAAGTGTATTPGATVPFTLPGAPTLVALDAVDGGLRVELAQPSNGGSAIIRYEYRLDSDPWVSTGSSATTFGIGGLTNGVARTVQVRAVNAAGAGEPSSERTATPRSAPGAPAISTVALDTGAIDVEFSLAADGGSPITNYEYSVDGGATWITRAPASPNSPVTISGLTGGRTYEVALRAMNAAGAGAASNLSTVVAKGTPETPRSVSVTSGDRSLSIAFAAPANGGSPITNYEYSVDGGATWQQRVPASTGAPLTVTGLVNGASHQVQIRALNAVGAGEASATVNATPRTTPGAPTIEADTIVGVDGTLEVVFRGPDDDGGAAVTGYEYSTDAGRTWRPRQSGTTASPLVITTLSSDGDAELTGGQVYPVELRAVNAAGAGAASAVADGITTTAPDSPEIAGATALDAAAMIELVLPANGGAEIVRFEYRLDGGAWTDTGSLSDRFLIEGLENSRTYGIEVRAVNGRGPSAPSAVTQVAIRTAPAAPGLDAVRSGNRSLQIDLSPADDGGSAVTSYEYSTDGGATWRSRSTGTTESPMTITTMSTGEPLANGVIVIVQVRARNAAGPGDASRSMLIAPLGAPDAPGSVTATAGDGQLTIGYAAGSDGGSAVSATEYRLDGGRWTNTGSLSSPFTITGLVNGQEHTVEVRLVNEVGPSDASAPVSAIPMTAPSQPGSVTADGADATVTATWTAPTELGGAPILSSTVTLYDQPVEGIAIASCTVPATDPTPTDCQLGGLENGRTLYLSVMATNAAGSGPASAPRVAVTPLAAPRVEIASVAVGANLAQVDLDVDDGGAPISNFEFSLDGGDWMSAATSSEPVTITGLVTGRTYAVRFRAVNAVGTGSASTPVDVTPRTTPGAPLSPVAQSGDRSVAVSWSAPEDDGGEAVSDHVVQFASSVGGPYVSFDDGVSAADSATVTGLTNGTEYFFRVLAVNGAGAGLPSPVVAATPLAAPSAPTITTLTPGNRFIQIAFTASSSNGGSAVTRYEYALDGGTWRPLPSLATTQTISGLDNGHRYSVTLRAVNAVGGGTPSAASLATPFGVPGMVQGFTASPGTGDVTLTWDELDDNGSPITAYNVIRWSARTEGSILASYAPTATSLTVPSLANGTHYFTIEATNAAGTGQRTSPRTTAMVGSAVPSAPTIDSGAVVPDTTSGHRLDLRWTAGAPGGSAITGTIVRRLPVSGPSVTLATLGAADTSADLPLRGLVAGDRIAVAHVSAVGVGPFTTLTLPSVSAATVADVTPRGATVAGVADAGGEDVVLSVEFAPSGGLGTGASITVAADPAGIDGDDVDGPVDVSAALVDLDPNTRYQARVVAGSGPLRVHGSPVEFTTDVALSTADVVHTYDGTAPGLSSMIEPAGLDLVRTFEGIDGTDHQIGTDVPVRAGSYRVVTSVAEGQGIGTSTSRLTIDRRVLGLDVTAAGKVYDGTTDVSLSAELSGVLDGDDVSLDLDRISGAFVSADAGVDRVVDLEADDGVLIGTDADNYSTTVPSTTTATIVVRSQALEFTGTVPDTLEVGETWTPTVTSTAGLTAELSLALGADTACALVAGEVQALAEGACVLVATQAGTPNVTAALPIFTALQIDAAPPPTTTTTVPPTTVPPTTVPSTTVPPTTSIPSTTVPTAPSTTVPPTTAPPTSVPASPTTVPSTTAPSSPVAQPQPALPLVPSTRDTEGRSPSSRSNSSDRSERRDRAAGSERAAADSAAANEAAAAAASDPGSNGVPGDPAAADGAPAEGRTADSEASERRDGVDRGIDDEVLDLGEETAESVELAGSTPDDDGTVRRWWIPTALAAACCLWFVLRAVKLSRR